jgi:multiple sugar transport system substrate-binding protein
MYQTFIPGTLSWLDPSNNKAFLDGQISVTNNGISIYYAAKNSQDPKLKEIAADMNHAVYPIGPVGVSTSFQLFLNQITFKYSKYPKAAKEFIRFMMEEEQFGPWMQASIGYVCHPLRAYKNNPIWTVDPKHTPFRDVLENTRPGGYAGKLGYASAGVLADFIIVDMVAEAASGSKTPKEAAERAQKRAERYYKV